MQDNSNGAKTSSYGGMSYGGASGEGTSYGGYSGGYGGGATQDYGSAGAPPGGGALEQYSGYSGYTGYGGMPPPAEDYGYGTPAVSVPARPATPQLANPSPDGRLLPETSPSASRLTVSDAVWLWRLRSSRFPPDGRRRCLRLRRACRAARGKLRRVRLRRVRAPCSGASRDGAAARGRDWGGRLRLQRAACAVHAPGAGALRGRVGQRPCQLLRQPWGRLRATRRGAARRGAARQRRAVRRSAGAALIPSDATRRRLPVCPGSARPGAVRARDPARRCAGSRACYVRAARAGGGGLAVRRRRQVPAVPQDGVLCGGARGAQQCQVPPVRLPSGSCPRLRAPARSSGRRAPLGPGVHPARGGWGVQAVLCVRGVPAHARFNLLGAPGRGVLQVLLR